MDIRTQITSNPLLHGLEIDRDPISWGKLLHFNPLAGVNVRGLSRFELELQVEQIRNAFIPTRMACEAATSIHKMLINGLIERHPYTAAGTQALRMLSQHQHKDIQDLPDLPTNARGMIFEGITKQGKSRLIQQVLSQYPQVILRGPDPLAGWQSCKQLLHLVIPMPTDSGKGAFLHCAYQALDAALGTNYSSSLPADCRHVGVQLVKLLGIFAQHRLGLLIIEETQSQNKIANFQFGYDYLHFFLRVLNAGIPTIVVGNPNAFDKLGSNSQAKLRLIDGGHYEFEPIANAACSEWSKDLVPGIWDLTIFELPDAPIENLDQFLWERTGGLVHLLNRLRVESLVVAIRSNADRVELSHIKRAMQIPAIKEGMMLGDAFRRKDADALGKFDDVNADYFRRKWLAEREKKGASASDVKATAAAVA